MFTKSNFHTPTKMGNKGISRSKQSHKIVPNEPSNIFEYSMMQRTSKPVRIVDFNELVVDSPIKQIDGIKRLKKATQRNFIDFDGLLSQKKEEIKFDIFRPKQEQPKSRTVQSKVNGKMIETGDKDIQKDGVNPQEGELLSHVHKDASSGAKTITKGGRSNPVVHKTLSARVLASLNEHSTITDLIRSYVLEKQKRSKSPYLEDLKDKLIRDNLQIEDINLEKEVVHLEGEIENINRQELIWKELKEDVYKRNTTSDLDLEDLNERFKKSVNINLKSQFERGKEQIDKKLTEKLAKLNFLKESVSLNIKNIKARVEEDEKKIFTLTENGSEFDTMVLLKAITRSR